MKAAIRCRSLTLGGTGPLTLHSMELHGKRLDGTGRARRIREAEPLVVGSLDLRREYDAHVDGARQNAGLKRPVLHFVCQFPTVLKLRSEADERWMLNQAVGFVNATHGGQAVFAARLDRDEAGRHAVDVFAAPKYEKRTKRTPPDRPGETWISPTRHGKLLCGKHREEIERRHRGRFSTGPRQVGIALNSEWADHLRRQGYGIDPKTEKAAGPSDRLEPEQLKAARDAETRLAELRQEERDLEARRMSPGSLLTGGLRRRETELLHGEDDLERRREEQEAAAAKREEELEVRQTTAGQDMEARDEGIGMIADGLALPRSPTPGDWGPGSACGPGRWKEVRRPLDRHRWSAAVWRDLRRFAASCGNALARLRKKVADLRADRDRQLAARQLLEEQLEELRPAGRQQTANGRLLRGAAAGDLQALDSALAADADPNCRLESGSRRTALHLAAEEGHDAAVARLLDAGANPTLQDDRGRTPQEAALAAALEIACTARRRRLEDVADRLREAEKLEAGPETGMSL